MSLSLFSDWQLCSACGSPPAQGKKLLTCGNCKSVAYHNNGECQKWHWKQGHKSDCKSLSKAMTPLLELMGNVNDNGNKWWQRATSYDQRQSNAWWETSLQKWNRQDYLPAMQGFQRALEPYQKCWKESVEKKLSNGTDSHGDDQEYALTLARRLLFCAYCELDGEEINGARQRLVQCLSILLLLKKSATTKAKALKPVLDDAWMELMLSMEEVEEHRILARHVAQLAISSSAGAGAACGWTHPLQRPGYMAMDLPGTPYFPPDQHPDWCRVLEEHWEQILGEYQSLSNNVVDWYQVGSGDRGSGQDDHRVVAGKDWTEYVLFGTGAREAPLTQSLLRKYVPDAVSLAEQGGGEVIFSRLAPHTHIQTHCGPTNLRWTAHLGLVIPDNCRIRVAQDWHTWQPGKVLLFDDSYEHEVRNDSDQERVVLLLRVWHPQSQTREQCLVEARAQKEQSVEKRYNPPK
jgi:hypothetical protein